MQLGNSLLCIAALLVAAGSAVGAEMVEKSPPDGYTIMLATITLATNPSMYKSLSFDPIKDFARVI